MYTYTVYTLEMAGNYNDISDVMQAIRRYSVCLSSSSSYVLLKTRYYLDLDPEWTHALGHTTTSFLTVDGRCPCLLPGESQYICRSFLAVPLQFVLADFVLSWIPKPLNIVLAVVYKLVVQPYHITQQAHVLFLWAYYLSFVVQISPWFLH